MKVSVTATQRGLTGRQRVRVYERLRDLRPSVVIHGGCVGGDDQVDQVAVELGIPRVVFPSNHKTKALPFEHFKRRGGSVIFAREPLSPLKRNPLIVEAGERLIACPKEPHMVIRSGTWATVRHARRQHKLVEVIEP